MATRRAGSKGKSRGKQAAKRTRSGSSRSRGKATRKRTTGSRQAKANEAARALRASEEQAAAAGAEVDAAAVPGPDRPQLRLAEAPAEHEPAGANPEATRAAAELARRIEEEAGAAQAEMERAAAAASEELGRRREEMEAEARRAEDARELPGTAAMALELTVGALRLVRAMATAPIRIGLAFLRPREA